MPKIEEAFLVKNKEYNPTILQVLFNRGITEKDDIEMFLKGDYENSHDPFLFKDMEEAIDLIISHIKQKNKIVIFGDFDADGITSSACLFETLSALQADVEVYIPDRISEGYGVNKQAIDNLAKNDTKLIITVDTGIRNGKEVSYAMKKGVDVIVSDHHTFPEDENDLPSCLIINPIKDNYPFKVLAGVGVAFKVSKALISKANLSDDLKQQLEMKILDLVAIGTVADCVPLIGENRILLKKGLEILNKSNRLGVKELLKIAKINHSKKISSWNIGFQIGPRLNAASRMGHANNAFKLLVSKDIDEAKKFAEELNQKNIERQVLTQEIIKDVEQQIDPNNLDNIIVGICPEGKSWSQGIIGLVAGKINNKYNHPTLIITKTADGSYKGSGRSIAEFNLMAAIGKAGDYLEKYGGHKLACGFSLTKENLKPFSDKIKEIGIKELSEDDLKPKLLIDCELDIVKIEKDLVSDIELLAPFGQNNAQPKFISKNVRISDIIELGAEKQHIKFKISEFWALSFGKAKEYEYLNVGDEIDIVYFLEFNDFNGRVSIQLKVVDIKKSENK